MGNRVDELEKRVRELEEQLSRGPGRSHGGGHHQGYSNHNHGHQGHGHQGGYDNHGGHGHHGHRMHFRSIDTWLDGACVSHCDICSWGELKAAAGFRTRLAGGFVFTFLAATD